MKLKQQEMIRLLFFIATFGSAILTEMNINEMNEFLMYYNLTIEDIERLFLTIEATTVFGASWMELITKEHKMISANYKEVLKKASDLFKMFEVENEPVKSFALYVYLYREGYLSWNHQFCFSSTGKDFAKMNGADIILGKGVCRAISSLYADICNQSGMEASIVPVKVNSKSFKDAIKLCPINIKTDKKNKRNETIDNILDKIIPYIPLANHIVTHISHNGMKYDFDPTNDILLTEKNGKLYVSNSTSSYITHDRILSFIQILSGQLNADIRCVLGIKDNKLPTISHDEYVKLYSETLEMIKENLDILEEFYKNNRDNYEEIASIANEQHSFIKRFMPILPIK